VAVTENRIILNEGEARRARSAIQKFQNALQPFSVLETAKSDLPIELVEKHREALAAHKIGLELALSHYERAKAGDYAYYEQHQRHDPGFMLILARIARGLSQRDLAEKLGIKEQQIQRYEADRYRAISLQNFRRIAHLLGLEFSATIPSAYNGPADELAAFKAKCPKPQTDKMIKFLAQRGWINLPESASADERILGLLRFIGHERTELSSRTFYRTGLKPINPSENLALTVWRAAVIRRAEAIQVGAPFDWSDITWLRELARLSKLRNGPFEAVEFLRKRGILLVIEPQLPGLILDGAALKANHGPLVALTLRHDRVDSFWFTLFHELAHVILHGASGLEVGFFDDLDEPSLEKVEEEANEFASAALIPPAQWKISSARISREAAPAEKLASSLGIHPAIVFGRIRRERGYHLFSDKVGTGLVRSLFSNISQEQEYAAN
jgi:HTH-type transcriptional regulator/antitoxin HigA